jgi:hypothetical protein
MTDTPLPPEFDARKFLERLCVIETFEELTTLMSEAGVMLAGTIFYRLMPDGTEVPFCWSGREWLRES